jgi:hypothetical protein
MKKRPELADYNLDKSKINYYIAFYKKVESNSNKITISLIVILAVYFDCKIMQKVNPVSDYEIILAIGGFLIYGAVIAVVTLLFFWIVQIFFPIERVLYLIPKLKKEKVLADAYSQRHQKYIADVKKFDEIKRQEIQELEKLRIQEERRQRQLEINYWTRLSGFEYEKEVAILFREIGYKVHLTKSTGDGGIDLLLYDGSGKVVVQCKNHNKRISPGAVRDLYGTCISEKASKAIMICSGGFSDATRKFAMGKPIDLLDVHDLIRIRKTGFYGS